MMQPDAVLDELNEAVGHHVRTDRGCAVMEYLRQASVQQPQMQGPPQQQATENHQPMPPPPLQRMDIGYDPMTNIIYKHL